MSRHIRTYPAVIRALSRDGKSEPDGSYFRGHCAVFHGIDSYGTIMSRGCFDRDLDLFKNDGFIGGLNHNWNEPIGKPEADSGVDEMGLAVSAHVLDTDHGMTVRKLLQAGVCKKMSFAFTDLERRWLDREDDVRSYWKEAGYTPKPEDEERSKNGALLFTRIRVFEASPVMIPANDRADITEVRDGAEPPAGSTRSYLSLESHLMTVRDAVAILSDRICQIAALRASDGRSLPPERGAMLRSIRDRLEAALAACQPRATATDVASLRRDLFAMETAIFTELSSV